MDDIKNSKQTKFIGYLLLTGYLAFIGYFTFFSKIAKRDFAFINRYNVIPFRTIGQYLRIRNVSSIIPFIVNIIGNIAVFIPFGIIMPIIISKRKRNNPIFAIAIGAILLSLSIELIQYIMSVGVFDVDDLILNTIGALMGYFMYVFVRKLRG
jgi:glycopeptide antibiotics resistance protein